MNVDRLVFACLVFLTLCRWVLASSLELSAEEALFWMESERLGPFFLQEGPLAGALIRVGTSLLGETTLAVRLFNPILVLLASGFLFLLARSAYHQVVARWSLVLFHLCPAVNVAGILMIDAALAFFLVLGGWWFLWCALHRANRWHPFWWAAGGMLGLSTTLSPALAVHLAGAAVALACTPRWRAQWGRPGPWILFLAAGLAGGAFYGASGHGILVLRHTFHGLGFHPREMGSGMVQWAFWTSPLLVAGLGWTFLHLGRGASGRAPAFLTLLGGVSLGLGFLWSGLCARPWDFALWTGTAPWLVVLVGQWMQADLDLELKGRWRRWALVTTGTLAAIGANTENLHMLGIPWPRVASTPRLETGWEETAEALEAVLAAEAAEKPDARLFLIADHPHTAALLDFYLSASTAVYRPDPIYPRVHAVESAGWDSVYGLWPNYSHAPLEGGVSPFRDGTALLVSREPLGGVPANVVHGFKSIEPAAVLEIVRARRVVHRWHLYHAYAYHGLPL